jgi:glycosyltransferase involved in cell wall biosynthesis
MIQRGKTGIAQHLFGLLRALDSLPDQHEFLVFALEEDLPLFQFAGASVRVVPVSERFREPLKNILWHQRSFPRLLREERVEVAHVPSYRRLIWTRPCPCVGTIHDLAPFHVPAKYDWKRMIYGRLVVKYLARRQDRIIAVSENTARDIRKFFRIPSERLHVIFNGVDHERFHPRGREKGKAGNRYGMERPFFLYVARLEHPGKNHVRLISAFDRFKAETRSDWQLVLAGSDWHGAEAIHQAVRSSPFSHDIRCLGFVREEDLPDLYRAADAFLYPSLYEGFGMPPIEAMACGCPVISSSRGSLGEVVGSGALIVDPENADEIQAGMIEVWRNDSIREKLRAAGLARASSFTWEKAARKTLEVYQLARPGLRPGEV